MTFFLKVLRVSKTINNVNRLFSSISINTNVNYSKCLSSQSLQNLNKLASIHTTTLKCDLMEFFDTEKNWTKQKIPTGRSWKLDELRIKSNEDLHKLWYILLKERNMLKTMEHACNEEYELFPSPERIDKVEESMKNLESVVRERNEAYYQLETGESGEQPAKFIYNVFGLKQYHKLRQYLIPKSMNRRWHKRHLYGFNGHAVRKFLRLYREKLWKIKKRERNTQRNRAIAIVKRFPNVNLEALKKQYPLIDLDYVMKCGKTNFMRLNSRRY